MSSMLVLVIFRVRLELVKIANHMIDGICNEGAWEGTKEAE